MIRQDAVSGQGTAGSMRFGVYVPNFGQFGDPERLVELGRLAEQSGWDGFFVWDYVIHEGEPTADPWIVLGAVASHTSKIALGPLVVPLVRRELSKIAHEVVTLDALSRGRVIIGAGLGTPGDFQAFGLDADPRARGIELTRRLRALRALLRGADTGMAIGAERPAVLLPQPYGGRDIPIWLAGRWPAESAGPFRRAAEFDGIFPVVPGWAPPSTLMPADQYQPLARMLAEFGQDHPVLVHGGASTGEDLAADARKVSDCARAGVAWWLESFHPERGGIDDAEKRIGRGPPRPLDSD